MTFRTTKTIVTQSRNFIFLILLALLPTYLQAEEVTYAIASYNADAQDFVLQSWGKQPENSTCYFINEYGATAGNRFNQIPRNREASFILQGWEGCSINSVTFGMCSNNKAGTFGVAITDTKQDSPIYSNKVEAFNTWYGMWVSKDLGIYVDIPCTISSPSPTQGDINITLKGGTEEGSVYVKYITIDYNPNSVPTESPMGYVYEKMEAKGTLNEGDIIMLYRSGDAAADIDGMSTSHYLDAIGVTSTSNVYEYDVERFTLNKVHEHWTLTDQYGRQLGATAAQSLAWDEGVTTWDITLGYNGATIASTNTKYGTLRYNAPAGTYPRFWNYTSTSLALPYIYRRVKQLEPVISQKILIPAERTVSIDKQDTVVIKATLTPATTTDNRISWESSNNEIASVSDGIVKLHKTGSTIITATAKDRGSMAQMKLTIESVNGIHSITTNKNTNRTFTKKFLKEGRLLIQKQNKIYDTNGVSIIQ